MVIDLFTIKFIIIVIWSLQMMCKNRPVLSWGFHWLKRIHQIMFEKVCSFFRLVEMRNAEISDMGRYKKCPICTKEVYVTNLKRHYRLLHPQHSCKFCFFKNKSILHVRFLANPLVVCHLCGRGGIRQSYLARHLTVHQQAPIMRCTSCPEMFGDLAALMHHNRQVHGAGSSSSSKNWSMMMMMMRDFSNFLYHIFHYILPL